jgi:acyl-CoA thioesterase
MTGQSFSEGDALSVRVGEKMMQSSPVLHHWGIELTAIAPGAVTMVMTNRDDMSNLHGQCHGGVLFTLADACFGFAANSYNPRTVAASCDIRYLKPAEIGDVITARSVEVWKRGRGGLYDVTMTNQEGDIIAVMRGHARMTKGTHVEPDC